MTDEQLDRFLQLHSQTSLSISELLSKFLEGPASTCQEVAIQSRIRRAAFPTDATLESYDWTRNPKTIRKETFLELATGRFIARKENAAFVGLSGLGKTHLIQGVGRKCCALGYRVRYETSASLIESLNRARAIKALTPKVKHYCSYDLLIIDEFGFEKLERKEVPDALSMLYKVIDGRNRRSSTAIITNVNLKDWTDYLGDPPMTMALLDRVIDQTNLITLKANQSGTSQRSHEMRIDYRELKQQVRILDLLTNIGWKNSKGHGAQLRGPCPLPKCCEKSSDPASRSDSSFSVNSARNIYHCFRCQSAGSVLDFWQTYRTITLYQAAIELSQFVKSSNHTSK